MLKKELNELLVICDGYNESREPELFALFKRISRKAHLPCFLAYYDKEIQHALTKNQESNHD